MYNILKKFILILFIFNGTMQTHAQIYQEFMPSPEQQKRQKFKMSIYHQSGDCQNGYGIQIFFKKTKAGICSYYEQEGRFQNGIMNGFGKCVFYEVSEDYCEILQSLILKRDYDSLAMISQIANIPMNIVYDKTDLNRYVRMAAIGEYRNGILMKGKYLKPESISKEGIFHNGQLYYGKIKLHRDSAYRTGFVFSRDWQFGKEEIVGNSGVIVTDSVGITKREFFHDSNIFKDWDEKQAKMTYHPERKMVTNMPFDGGTYTGEFYNGRPEGWGEWIGDDFENIKTGYFKNGVMHGIACFNYPKSERDRYDNITGYLYDTLYGVNKRITNKMKVVAFFNNGVIEMARFHCGRYSYSGKVDEKLLPNGPGVKTWADGSIHEKGEFIGEKLNGYGVRVDNYGTKNTGYFIHGVYNGGRSEVQAGSLNNHDVIMLQGKKMMVIFKTLSHITLNDGSFVGVNTMVTLATGGNAEFFETCTICHGTGISRVDVSYNKVWIRDEYIVSKTMERIGSQMYEKTTTTKRPIYEEQRVEKKMTCRICEGTGRSVKKKS
jgi:hypothetical protein